jgi:uncharacterized protein YndB with AHSA1/START domain
MVLSTTTQGNIHMDIVHQLIARTTPDKVYQALTDPAQLASWFAEDTQAGVQGDSEIEFRFDRGTIRVQVTELEPDQKVVWKVLEGLPGWEGVTGHVTWELTYPFYSGTLVHFTHSGWAGMDGPYPSTNFKWGWFIARMKAFAETGVASPAIV